MCAGGRLAVYAGVLGSAGGAELPRVGPADLADAADGGRRTAADAEAGPPDQRGRVLRPYLPQDGVPVFGVDAAWRGGDECDAGDGDSAGRVRAESWFGVPD